MKVAYRTAWGTQSTAYVNDDPDPDGAYTGENKHTGEPVRLRWSGTEWVLTP